MVEVVTDSAVLEDNEFQIVKDGEITRAIRPELHVEVEGGRIFHRNAIRWPGNRRIRWLVVELDGVRVFINAQEGGVIVTKRDLYP